MTKQRASASSAVAPQGDGAPGDGFRGSRIEVMVTSEMIGAGIDELKAYEDGGGETASETVTRIYLAMLEVALGRTSLG
jgi:hypothetical protein